MADLNAKVSANVAGRFFVDATCIACEACLSIAPLNFKLLGDNSCAYVCKQPANQAEEAACRQAVDSCPVGAIGDEA